MTPEEVLSSNKSIFSRGTKFLGNKALGMYHSTLMPGELFTGVPLNLELPESTRGMTFDTFKKNITGQMDKQFSALKPHNGIYFRKAPFLWSQTNMPITQVLNRQSWAKDQFAYQSIGRNPADVQPVRHKVMRSYGKYFPGAGASTMVPLLRPLRDEHLSQLKHGLDAFPKGTPLPKSIKFRRGSPYLMGTHYNPISKNIVMNNFKLPMMYHEMGHAADLAKPSLYRKAVRGSRVLDRGLKYAVPAALLMGDSLKKAIPGSLDDKVIGALQAVGPEAWLASRLAGQIVPEMRANKFMNARLAAIVKDVKTKEGLKVMSNMKRAGKIQFGKYLAGAAVHYGLFALARYIGKKKRNKMEKTSSLASIFQGYVGHPLSQARAIADNIKHVVAPITRPGLADVRRFVTGPKSRNMLYNYVLPAGLGAGIVSLVNRQRDKVGYTEPVKETKYYKAMTMLPYNPFLASLYAGSAAAGGAVMDALRESALLEGIE